MPLPNILEFIGNSVTQAGFKTALEKLLSYLNLEGATKAELNAAVTPKADKEYVDNALNTFQSGSNLFYSTLADANADIANIRPKLETDTVKDLVNIGEIANGGTWYKASASSSTLTKNPYDILGLAKADSKEKADAAFGSATSYIDSELQPIKNVLLVNEETVVDLKALALIAEYIDLGGNVVASTGFVRSNFIEVSEDQIIDISAVSHGAVAMLSLYDANKMFLRYVSGTPDQISQIVVDIQNNEKFIRVCFFADQSIIQYAKLITPALYKEIPSKTLVDNLAINNNYVNKEVAYRDFDKIGYYSLDGVNYIENQAWATFAPVFLKKGQTLTISVYGQDGTAAFLYIKDGDTNTIVWGASGNSPSLQTFDYTAAKNVYFWFNTQSNNASRPLIGYKLKRDYIYLDESTIDHEVPSMQNFKDLKGIVNSYWKGKKIVWVGTSIPAFIETDGISYPYMIGKMLGCNMQNNALGESFITYNAANPNVLGAASFKTLSATVQEIKSFYGALYPTLTDEQLTAYANAASYEKLIIGTNADLIVFDHLHNDIDKYYVTYDVSEINSTDRKSFYGAFNYIIERLYADNPDVRIAFVSCPNRFLRDNPAYTLEKFDAFRTALRNLALKYNAPFIDLAILSNTNQFNYHINTSDFDKHDGDLIHPSVSAKARYAAILAENIRAIA